MRKLELNAEQRAALATMLGVIDDKPHMAERLSVHARLLISEIVMIVHAPPDSSSNLADPRSPLPRRPSARGADSGTLTLHAAAHNVGIGVGVTPDDAAVDLFWQSVAVHLEGAGDRVPLISGHVDGDGQAEGRHVDGEGRHVDGEGRHVDGELSRLEVDSTATYTAAGFAAHLPSLCARADSAHSRAAWQLAMRWVRGAPDADALAPVGGVAMAAETSLAVRVRSTEELHVLVNHAGSILGCTILERSLSTWVDGHALSPLPRGADARPRGADGRPRGAETSATLRHVLGTCEGVRVHVALDAITPTWLLLLAPSDPGSDALAISAGRVKVRGDLSRADAPPSPTLRRRSADGPRKESRLEATLEVLRCNVRHAPLSRWAYAVSADPQAPQLLAPFDARLECASQPIRSGQLDARLGLTELICNVPADAPGLLTRASTWHSTR